MAFLDEIDAILAANTTEVGSGSSYPVFLGHLPDSTQLGDRAVALINTPGGPSDGRVAIERPGLQVVVRGPSINSVSTGYEEAEATAVSVRDALHEYTGSADSLSRHYVGILTASGPFFGGFDEDWRPHFPMNFDVMRSRTT